MEDAIQWVFATYPSWSHLVVRLILGIVFFAHGAQKVFGWFGGGGLSPTIAGFRQMNIPPAAGCPSDGSRRPSARGQVRRTSRRPSGRRARRR